MWWLRLGDPGITGLGMTALYFVVTFFMFRHALALPHGGERRMWIIASTILLLLAINKQLDLQHYMNKVGHCVYARSGLIAEKDAARSDFGTLILALAAIGTAALIWAFRRHLANNLPLIAGLALIALYLAMQVSRFEHLAGGLLQRLAELRVHRLIEAAGLLTLLYASLHRRRANIAA